MSLERLSKRHEIIAHDVVVVVFDVWFNFGVPHHRRWRHLLDVFKLNFDELFTSNLKKKSTDVPPPTR